MSALLDRRPADSGGRRAVRRQHARSGANATCALASAQSTLDELVGGAWQELVAHRSVDCLICGAVMTPRYGASGHAPVGGRCDECGASFG
jgi:hypothetical protein